WRGGVGLRQALPGRGDRAPGLGRRAAGPVRPDARLRVAAGWDLLERATGRRGLRPAAHDPPERHLRSALPPPGRRGPAQRPRPVGRGEPALAQPVRPGTRGRIDLALTEADRTWPPT